MTIYKKGICAGASAVAALIAAFFAVFRFDFYAASDVNQITASFIPFTIQNLPSLSALLTPVSVIICLAFVEKQSKLIIIPFALNLVSLALMSSSGDIGIVNIISAAVLIVIVLYAFGILKSPFIPALACATAAILLIMTVIMHIEPYCFDSSIANPGTFRIGNFLYAECIYISMMLLCGVSVKANKESK